MRTLPTIVLSGMLASLAPPAKADRVHLHSGAVIEGNAKRVGEKVIVEVESGTLTLSAGSVQRIEESETVLERVEARYRALAPNDVHGLFRLADYCRDHGLRAREQELLHEVLEASPDHPEARARLGYVRTEAGWVTREEQLRAQGLVKRDGRWLTPEQLLALERLEAETRIAELRRDQARLELENMRADLATKRAEAAHRERMREEEQSTARAERATYVPHYAPYLGPVGFPLPWPRSHELKPNPTPPPGPGPSPSPIPGFRDPSNTTWQVPGFRDPRSYF